MRYITVCSLFLVLVVISCMDRHEIQLNVKHNLSRVYTDSSAGFSISLPPDWETVPGWNQTTVTAMGKPLDESLSMRLDGSVAVKMFMLEGYTSSEIFEKNTAYLKNEKDYKVLEKYNCELSGLDAVCIIYSVTEDEAQVINTQFYVCAPDRCAILNGSASADLFERYRDLYLQIGLSFRFL